MRTHSPLPSDRRPPIAAPPGADDLGLAPALDYADLVARVVALMDARSRPGARESSADVAEEVIAEVTRFALEWSGA